MTKLESLISESKELMENSPSKDTRFFSKSVYEYLNLIYIELEPSEDARELAQTLFVRMEKWLDGDYDSIISDAAALITARDERIRRGCADRGVKWCNSPLDELGEHEDDDEWWNNGLRAAIMGRKE